MSLHAAKAVLLALLFGASGFIAASCTWKLVREGIRARGAETLEWRLRKYTDGMQRTSRGTWQPVRSDRPVLRLAGVTAAWLIAAAASGLALWRLVRPSRRDLARVAVAELLAAVALVIVFAFLKPYQRERIRIAIDPSLDPLGSGFASMRMKERFTPPWRVTAAAAVIAVAAALPAAAARRR